MTNPDPAKLAAWAAKARDMLDAAPRGSIPASHDIVRDYDALVSPPEPVLTLGDLAPGDSFRAPWNHATRCRVLLGMAASGDLRPGDVLCVREDMWSVVGLSPRTPVTRLPAQPVVDVEAVLQIAERLDAGSLSFADDLRVSTRCGTMRGHAAAIRRAVGQEPRP